MGKNERQSPAEYNSIVIDELRLESYCIMNMLQKEKLHVTLDEKYSGGIEPTAQSGDLTTEPAVI